MATLTGKLVSETYKALLKMIDNDILTESEKQISDGFGQGTGIFIDDNGFIRASVFKVTGGSSSQFLKADGSLDGNSYLTAASASALFLPIGSTTTVIPEGTNLYFTNARVLTAPLTGFVSTEGTVTAADTVLSAFNKIWWNIENGGGGGGGYVPYTGATQNLNLGTYGLISDFVQFNLAPTSIPTTAGTMSWNAADGTVDLKMGGANVTLQVGQEELVRVVNKTGANLLEANYQAVRISGAQGNRLKVALAKADNDANSADTIGLVTETINNNAEGFVTAVGLVRNIDTTGDLQGETWADGDPLYLSATTAGVITNIKPQAPEHGVRIGYVVRAHQTQGQIYVKVDNGYELDELHNVLITDPLDEDVLFYDGVESLWINKNIYSAINATDVGKSLLAILNAEDTTPVTTKPRGIRINVDNTVDALEVGTQGYLPFYDETDFYIDSPVFTDGDQVFIGGDDSYLSVNSKLTVVGGNLTVDDNWGIHLGLYQILFRYNVTGELRFGTGVPNDFTTFYANAIERMRLNASGYLGIGLTNPSQPLHVKGVLAYPKIIIDNNSTSGGGMFSAYQNGTETAMFGVSGAWLINNSSDAAIVATRAGQGIQFFTNGSTSEKMGINSDGNVFVGQTPTYVAGATQLIVRGKTGAGFLGVNHYDMSIKGSINTFNNVFQVGTSTFHSVAFIVEDIERARINSGGRMLLGTTSDNTTDIFQANGSIIASAIKKTGGTSTQYLMADGSVSTLASYVPTSRTLTINGTGYDLTADRSWSVGTVTSVSASVPTGFAISGSPITSSGTLAITFASGYALPTTIKQSNWDDAYTFVAAFPTQTGNAGKYLTTDGSSLSWGTVTAGVSSFNTRTGAVSLTSTDVTTALGFTPVTQARTLSINGTTYDLSADRSWTISAGSSARNVSTFTATAGQTIFTIAGGYTPNLVDVFLNGVRLTGVDFTATNGTTIVLAEGVRVNDIIDVVNYTNATTSGVTGSGTSGYLPKWTGTSVVSNSLIFDNGTSVGIGTITPSAKLHLVGTLRINSTSVSNQFMELYTDGGISYYHSQNNSAFYTAFQHIFYTDGASPTEKMRLTTGGNLGLGTTTPSGASGVTLEINGAAGQGRLAIKNNATGSSSLNGLQLGVDTGGGAFIEQRGANSLLLATNGTGRIFITSAGNIGISTTSPLTNLTVGDSATQQQPYLSLARTATGGYFAGIRWYDGTTVKSIIQEDADFNLRFSTSNTERFRIASGGNIQIGGTNFGGDAKVGISNNNNEAIEINPAISSNTGRILYYNRGTSTYITSLQVASDFQFQTSGNERMRITNIGDILFGKTAENAAVSGFQYRGAAPGLVQITRDGGEPLQLWRYSSNGKMLVFFYNGSEVGSISSNTSSLPSDLNFKKDVQNIKLGLDFVNKLRPVHYRHKLDSNNEPLSNGIIAQEMEQALLDCGVSKNELLMLQYRKNDNPSASNYWVDYTKLIPVLIQSIKELNAKLESK